MAPEPPGPQSHGHSSASQGRSVDTRPPCTSDARVRVKARRMDALSLSLADMAAAAAVGILMMLYLRGVVGT